jgi:hypothetical protein
MSALLSSGFWVESVSGTERCSSCEDMDCSGPCPSEFRSTFLVSEPAGLYPSSKADTTGVGVVSNAGAVLLVTLGLDQAMSAALARLI